MTWRSDFTDVMAELGGTIESWRRSAVSYSNSGAGTYTWAKQAEGAGMIQPYERQSSGNTVRLENGIEVYDEFVAYLPDTMDVIESDRLHPPGWASGDDEYEVVRVSTLAPSHLEVRCTRTKGHAS